MSMHGIHDPIQPELTDPLPLGAIAGNHSDDDGIAIDETLEAAPQGPIEYGAILPDVKNELPTTTRIINRKTVLLCTPDVPDSQMLFPADPNRVDLIIQCQADSQTDITITSERILNTGEMISALVNTAFEWRSDKHTGAVWITAASKPSDPGQVPIPVSAWSITR